MVIPGAVIRLGGIVRAAKAIAVDRVAVECLRQDGGDRGVVAVNPVVAAAAEILGLG